MTLRKKAIKKILAYICALLVVSAAGWKYTADGWKYTSINTVSAVAETNIVELDIGQGNITIDSTGYKVGDGEHVACTGKTYKITGNNADTESDTDELDNRLIITSGTPTIILDDVNFLKINNREPDSQVASFYPDPHISVTGGSIATLLISGENNLRNLSMQLL